MTAIVALARGREMFETAADVQVRSTPADAFEHVARGFFQNHSLWDTSVKSMKQTSPGPIGLGTTALEFRQFGPWRVVSEVRVSAFEPDRSFAFETTKGAMIERGQFTIEPRTGGSNVHINMRLQPASLFLRLLEPAMRPMFASNARRNIMRMREAIDNAATR